MSIRNKIKVIFYLEDGCTQEADEVSSHWSPINFEIYSDLFPDLIQEAIGDWLSENTVDENYIHEVIFAHDIDYDGGGAVTGEWFVPIYHEQVIR